MSLTKADIVETLYADIGLSKRDAKDFVDDFFELLGQTLEQGQPVKLSGFGNFDVRRKRERPGRNPKTGDAVPISARTVVTFHAGQKLKDRIDLGSPVQAAAAVK